MAGKDPLEIWNPVFGELNLNVWQWGGTGIDLNYTQSSPEYMNVILGQCMQALGVGDFWNAEPEPGTGIYLATGGTGQAIGAVSGQFFAAWNQHVVNAPWLPAVSLILTVLYCFASWCRAFNMTLMSIGMVRPYAPAIMGIDERNREAQARQDSWIM